MRKILPLLGLVTLLLAFTPQSNAGGVSYGIWTYTTMLDQVNGPNGENDARLWQWYARDASIQTPQGGFTQWAAMVESIIGGVSQGITWTYGAPFTLKSEMCTYSYGYGGATTNFYSGHTIHFIKNTMSTAKTVYCQLYAIPLDINDIPGPARYWLTSVTVPANSTVEGPLVLGDYKDGTMSYSLSPFPPPGGGGGSSPQVAPIEVEPAIDVFIYDGKPGKN
jgi:hypothetical protein